MEKILDLAPTCACANMRQTQLLVTQFYDEILAPGGLYAAQFGLLTAIFNSMPITINRLAQVMDMDRTAVNRELKILAERKLIRIEEGTARGASQASLTQEGEQVLGRTWLYWQEAQERVETAFGMERFNALLVELAAMRAVLNSGAA
jgi:DNA-binding MarR family transcriptional regulator